VNAEKCLLGKGLDGGKWFDDIHSEDVDLSIHWTDLTSATRFMFRQQVYGLQYNIFMNPIDKVRFFVLFFILFRNNPIKYCNIMNMLKIKQLIIVFKCLVFVVLNVVFM